MKYLRSLFCFLACLSFVGLTACGDTSNTISGTYSLESFGVIMSYTFSEDGVTAQFFMAGYEIGRYEGTYSLNDDRTQITLSFDPAPAGNHVELPSGLLSLGGTFSFREEDDYIVIGQIKYYRSDAKAEDFTPSSIGVCAPAGQRLKVQF